MTIHQDSGQQGQHNPATHATTNHAAEDQATKNRATDDFDAAFELALSTYTASSPRPGLEERILVSLAAQPNPATRPHRAIWANAIHRHTLLPQLSVPSPWSPWSLAAVATLAASLVLLALTLGPTHSLRRQTAPTEGTPTTQASAAPLTPSPQKTAHPTDLSERNPSRHRTLAITFAANQSSTSAPLNEPSATEPQRAPQSSERPTQEEILLASVASEHPEWIAAADKQKYDPNAPIRIAPIVNKPIESKPIESKSIDTAPLEIKPIAIPPIQIAAIK